MPEKETYVPSEKEKEKRWAVVEEWFGEDDGQMHVIPTFDKHHHLISKSCWCHPIMRENACVHGEEVQ